MMIKSSDNNKIFFLFLNIQLYKMVKTGKIGLEPTTIVLETRILPIKLFSWII